MEIRKLESWQDLYEADHLIATAFLHPFDPEEALRNRQEQDGKKTDSRDELFGLFDEQGQMTSAIQTKHMDMYFDGQLYPFGELEMVGSIPERRGSGSIRSMMQVILRDFRERGDLYAWLFPFSAAFYRKFGFESSARFIEHTCPVNEFASFTNTYQVCQVRTESQVQEIRTLYESFIASHNLTTLRDDAEWEYHRDGEYGPANFFHPEWRKYTYLFKDSDSIDRGYLSFYFIYGPNGPFIGDMSICDFVYDSPLTLRSMFGFIYSMRAKINNVILRLPLTLDLAALLPDPAKIERKLTGSRMLRVLDPIRILQAMRYPTGSGSFVIRIEDTFLTENTGSYRVEYLNGRAAVCEETAAPYDLKVTVETFTQLSLGYYGLESSLYRDGTELIANEETLSNVFVQKRIVAE